MEWTRIAILFGLCACFFRNVQNPDGISSTLSLFTPLIQCDRAIVDIRATSSGPVDTDSRWGLASERSAGEINCMLPYTAKRRSQRGGERRGEGDESATRSNALRSSSPIRNDRPSQSRPRSERGANQQFGSRLRREGGREG